MVPEPLRAAAEGGESLAIPGYELGQVIGRGATGTVYRARQVAVDREVALKVLHPGLSQRRRTVQRLQREARTTARLAHPHIVSAIDMGETGGRWWYAMEFVDGPSLAEILRQQGRLREREALRLFIPLCEALEHLAEHGVVHRDIKPANILIDKASGARIADLGLAFADDDPALTTQDGTLGTPHYISPEQAVDSARAGVQSDLWSFGATLYHAVTGRPPFQGESTAEVLSAVLHARIADPRRFEPTLSRGLTLVLRKCLTRDLRERYQAPHELLLDLERVRERRAPRVVAKGLDPIEREPRPWVRPLAAVLVVVLGLAAVIGLAVSLRPGGAGLAVEPPAGTERFGPLEAIAARLEGAEEPPGALLVELESLGVAVPAGQRTRWQGLREELRAELRTLARGLADQAEARAEAAIQAGDFAGASAAVGGDLARELWDQTGLAPEELEQSFGFLRTRRATLAAHVEEAERALVKLVAERLGVLVQERLSEADRLFVKSRFQSALDLVGVGDAALLAAAGYGSYRFASGRLEPILGEARVRLGQKRQEIDFAWRAMDAELRGEVVDRAARLSESLAGTGGSAALELERAFEAELFERGVERAEISVNGVSFALEELARAKRELERLEEERRAEDLRATFDLYRDLDDSRWERRDYAAVLSLWEEFSEALAEVPGGREHAWCAELERRTALMREEARLLQELKRRAAQGIAAANGTRREMRVLDTGIVEEGLVSASSEPLREGFELVPEQGSPYHFTLESIAARDLLAFAGIPAIDEDLDPAERLVVSAFRSHEGELARAEGTLRSGELPREGLAGELAFELEQRIQRELARQVAARDARDEEVSALLSLATEEAILAAPDRALMAIDKLLGEYADVSDVRVLRPRLQGEQARLESRARSFAEVYGPSLLEERRDGGALLAFSFDAEEAGAWEPLAWRYDGSGWSGPALSGDWTAIADVLGARLALRPPLDAERDVELKLRFQVLDQDAPARLLVVSALGFHVAISGPGLPGESPRSRFLVGSGDLEAFLADVGRGAGEESPRLLRPGEDQELVLFVNPRRGVVRVELDGVGLGRHSFPSRVPEPQSIVLRSVDAMRVLSAELRCSR